MSIVNQSVTTVAMAAFLLSLPFRALPIVRLDFPVPVIRTDPTPPQAHWYSMPSPIRLVTGDSAEPVCPRRRVNGEPEQTPSWGVFGMVTLLFLHAQWDHGLFASRLFDQLILGTPLVAINILGITVYTYDQLFWREFGWTGLVAVLFWMTIVLIWFVTLLS